MPIPRRLTTTPLISSLFCNIPIEAGATDAEIVSGVRPSISLKTFARLRVRPPQSVTCDQLLMLARTAEARLDMDAATVLAAARDTGRLADHPLTRMAMAETFPRGGKGGAAAERLCQRFASGARRIYLFDRGDSFAYLSPATKPETASTPKVSCGYANAGGGPAGGDGRPVVLRYLRGPRVFVALTSTSLQTRLDRYGDLGIEELIGNVETGQHSLTVLRDGPRVAHRLRPAAIGDCSAIAVFDRAAMFVLPSHERCVRLYRAEAGPDHARLIGHVIRWFRKLRRFRMTPADPADVTESLRLRLSYRLPERGVGQG